MHVIALVISAFGIALGMVGLVAPGRLVVISRWFVNPAGLYTAAALRLLLGAALFVEAAASRQPSLMRALGGVVFAAGVATPFIGTSRTRRLIDWWSAQGSGFQRAWSTVAIAFGAFVIWAVTP